MNTVSVVIPVFGRASLLERAIASVKRQNVYCEIIVIDDGSKPPLSSLLDDEVLAQIILLRNDENRNAAYSRNRGVKHAICDVVAFLDSDDEWLPSHLELALENINDCSSAIHVTPLKLHGATKTIDNPYSYLFDEKRDFRTSGLVCTKKTFYLVGGFDERLNKHQDWDFVLRASNFCRLRVGAKATIQLDVSDGRRMSARPNLIASAMFIEKHHQMMTRAQMASFFSGVIRSCIISGDIDQLNDCEKLVLQYIDEQELDKMSRKLWRNPRLGKSILRGRQLLRKYT